MEPLHFSQSRDRTTHSPPPNPPLQPLLITRLALSTTLTTSQQLPLRSVLIFRHCLRSTPTSAYGARGYNSFNNYSSPSHQFPEWPVAVYQCLPHGIDLLKEEGKSIGPSLPSPILFKVDTSAKRDNDTANALLVGLGQKPNTYVGAPELFDPVRNGNLCPALSKNDAIKALKARFAQSTPPTDHIGRLQRLQNILGKGVAPSIPTIPDTVKSNGYFTGGSSIASEFAEAFLMQFGGGLPTAWDEITDTKPLYDLLKTHIYYRGVNDRVFASVARSHTMMTQTIINHLKNGDGTLVLVGHDADLDALAELFGMEWETTPFPPNATTPGSALRFDVMEEDVVEASMHYQSYQKASQSKVLQVPATFTWAKDKSSTKVLLSDVESWVEPRYDPACKLKMN